MTLKEARKSAGLSQEALGNWLGVGKSVVCRYEKGQCVPPRDRMEMLIKRFPELDLKTFYGVS